MIYVQQKNKAERENIILSAAAVQAEKEISQLTDYQIRHNPV